MEDINEKLENTQEVWHHVITMEDVDNLKKKIHVVYDSEGVNLAFDKACELVSKKVQIKGFRKGKAPKALVKNVCRKQIEDTASTLLSNEGFLHACFEQKIQPLGKPEVDNAEFSIDGTFSCDIVVDIRPTIIPSGYVGMQLKKPEISVDDLAHGILEATKSQHLTIVEKEVVSDGDHIEVDFEVKCGDEEVSAGSGQHFEIKSGMEPPFGDNLIGMKVGETRESDYTIPENFRVHPGERAVVNVQLKNVHTKVAPSDEELVSKLGLSSMDELNEMVKKQAQAEANNRLNKILEEAAIDKLIELHEFDVPESWVKDEMAYMEKQFNISLEKDEKFREYVRNMAERNVRRTFIIDSIYDAESSLKITTEEVENLIKAEAERTGLSTLTIKDRLKKKHVMDGVLGLIRQKKVMNLILSQAQFTTDDDQNQQYSEESNFPGSIME